MALSGCAASSTSAPHPIAFDACLWRAARETVDFLPLEKTDPIAGTVETGWGSLRSPRSEGDARPLDRYRLVVHLDYSRIYADAATVDLQHRIRSGDSWLDAPADPAEAVALQKAIADAAGELRLAANSSKPGS